MQILFAWRQSLQNDYLKTFQVVPISFLHFFVTGLKSRILLLHLEEWAAFAGVYPDNDEYDKEEASCNCWTQLPDFRIWTAIEFVRIWFVAEPQVDVRNVTILGTEGYSTYRTCNLFANIRIHAWDIDKRWLLQSIFRIHYIVIVRDRWISVCIFFLSLNSKAQ